jgi:hypothetical protein
MNVWGSAGDLLERPAEVACKLLLNLRQAMTWTKLVCILAVGVVVAFAFRYFLYSDLHPTVSLYRTNIDPGSPDFRKSWYWEVDRNVFVFWACIIMTVVLVVVLAGRMMMRR